MEWKEVRLGELVQRRIGYGIVQPGASPTIGVPVIKVNNIIAGLTDIEKLDKTSEETDSKYPRTKLNGGELVISLVGSVGKTAIVPDSFRGCNLVRATGLVDIKDKALAYWVKYYVDSPLGQSYITSNLNTTVQATLNIKSLVDMPIPMPSEEYRSQIVSILSSLDTKIETNNKINAKLEEMAQVLFKSWFVDFEPFKDKGMVESELGMIPVGWRVGKLSEIAEVAKKSINPSKQPDTLFSHYSLPAFDENKLPAKQYGSEIMSNKFIFSNKTTLLSKLNPHIKRIWYIEETEDNAICSTEFLPFKAKDVGLSAFLYSYLVSDYFYLRALSIVQGATNSHQRLDAKVLLEYELPINDEAMLSFDKIVSPMLATICKNRVENSRLSHLRDTLLPKLMSGEIDLYSLS